MTDTDLQRRILEGIEDGSAVRFQSIVGRLVHLYEFDDREFRRVDRALQRMRSDGLIAFSAGRWRKMD